MNHAKVTRHSIQNEVLTKVKKRGLSYQDLCKEPLVVDLDLVRQKVST